MTKDDWKQMDEIKEFLTNMYQGANNPVKERIKILLRDEVITNHKCSDCGNKFPTNDENNMKSSILMFNNIY